MEKLKKHIVKLATQMVKEYSGSKAKNLYELEEMIFKTFQPLQKEVLEKTASSLHSEQSNRCKLCSSPNRELKFEGMKKNFLADSVISS